MSAHVLTIYLNLEEGNLLLEALAECPFKSVFELIGKLNQQANNLFLTGIVQKERQKFTFTESELSLSIKALGNMPYQRVHKLLAALNQQIQMQMDSRNSGVTSSEHADI
jgi:hypothetical protein